MKTFLLLFPKAGWLVLLFTMFLPFVVVTCNGNVLEEVRGHQMITGSSLDAGGEKNDVEPNIWIILTYTVGLIALVLSFGKKPLLDKLAMVWPVVCMVCLGIFSGQVDDEVPAQIRGMIQISLGSGYYIALISVVCLALFSVWKWRSSNHEQTHQD